MMCGSVATRMVSEGEFTAKSRMARVLPTWSAWSMMCGGHSGERRRGARMLGLELQQLGLAESLVDDADARPQQHVATGAAREIAAEVAVGAEDDRLILRYLAEDRVREELVTMMSLCAFTAAEQLM
jgi:hypothetical protein